MTASISVGAKLRASAYRCNTLSSQTGCILKDLTDVCTMTACRCSGSNSHDHDVDCLQRHSQLE